MSLAKQPKFAPSQRPYAVNRGSGHQDERGMVTFEAVWAGRKNGATTVSVGHLWDYQATAEAPPKPD